MGFNSLNLFTPSEHTKDDLTKGPNDKNFPFEIEDKKYIYVGENLFSFETNNKIVEHFCKEGFNDIKYPYAYSKENIYFMHHRKISLWKNTNFQHIKISMSYCIKKMVN